MPSSSESPAPSPSPASRPRFDPSYYSPVFDLFKYPIFVFSVLAALLLAQNKGMRVNKLGMEGIELETLKQEVDSSQRSSNSQDLKLYACIQTFEAAVAALKETAAPTQFALIRQAETRQDERANTVPEDLTPLATNPVVKSTSALEGWVYLGKVQNSVWRPFHLRTLNWASPGRLLPPMLDVGGDYRISNVNLIVRPTAPSDTLATAKSLGVLPSRTRVRLMAAPKAYPDGAATRCWAKVRVVSEMK